LLILGLWYECLKSINGTFPKEEDRRNSLAMIAYFLELSAGGLSPQSAPPKEEGTENTPAQGEKSIKL
jgi:hypothetical protein